MPEPPPSINIPHHHHHAIPAWHRGDHPQSGEFALGRAQFVRVDSQIIVANLIAQHGVKSRGEAKPIRYDALETALEAVAQRTFLEPNASIHMPRIGCGLAGGTWGQVEPIILRQLSAKDIPVTVYDFKTP